VGNDHFAVDTAEIEWQFEASYFWLNPPISQLGLNIYCTTVGRVYRYLTRAPFMR